jgi:hypothetical protein
VNSLYDAIPWPQVSRFKDEEMKQLLIDVVDRTYRFVHSLLDNRECRALLLHLAERDPAPHWQTPSLESRVPPFTLQRLCADTVFDDASRRRFAARATGLANIFTIRVQTVFCISSRASDLRVLIGKKEVLKHVILKSLVVADT